MTGTFRFVLALIVAFSHLAGSRYAAHMGFYAVRAFFVLSGYAMTSALNEVYGRDGLRFWSNRLLRLLPPYYAVCLATILAVRLWPEHAAAFLPRWGFAMSSDDVVGNLLVEPLAFTELKFRLVPPAWSVAVELMMYFVLYVGMARSLRRALLCLAFGVAAHSVWLVMGAPFDERYFTPAAALLSFALGATLYFGLRNDAKPADIRLGALATAGWTINLLAEGRLFPDGYALYGGFYVNVVLAGLVVVFLSRLDPGPPLKGLDQALGRLSYPVFLCQWLGGFVAYLVWSGTSSRGWGLALGACRSSSSCPPRSPGPASSSSSRCAPGSGRRSRRGSRPCPSRAPNELRRFSAARFQTGRLGADRRRSESLPGVMPELTCY